MADSSVLLQVSGLKVSLDNRHSGQKTELLAGVDFTIEAGQSLALMGPSGCGKSLTARALLGLLPREFAWSGEVIWDGRRLRNPGGTRWSEVRGRGIGLVLQEPTTCLNPVQRVGDQIAETIRVHQKLSQQASYRQAVDLLSETKVPHPELVAQQYAHQLSGGMRQRVLLAAALACQPRLLIADEPTTALDVSVQKDILALIHRLGRDHNMALLFITHDPQVAALMADRIALMSAGKIKQIISSSELAMTSGLVTRTPNRTENPPVLVVKNLSVRYDRGRQPAVSKVDFALRPGQALGLLGESGCGKSSLAKAAAGHLENWQGQMTLDGEPMTSWSTPRQRRRVQLLFQDPGASLSPRQTVAAALKEAGGGVGQSPQKLLAEVGLSRELATRFPHQLSGGQRQRVALARCLAAEPAVLIADEPTSALDNSSRDVVLALLSRIMAERDLAVLLITHDADVVAAFCDWVMIMKSGVIVEVLPGGERFCPRHPHTLDLLRSVPRQLRADRELWLAEHAADAASPNESVAGCPHYGNCPLQKAHCAKELPQLQALVGGGYLRCPEAEVTGLSHFIDT